MESGVVERGLGAAIETLAAGLDGLFEHGLAPVNASDAEVMVRELETQLRRLQAAQNRLLGEIDSAGWYEADGHASAKIMVRHVAKLSPGEAAARQKVMRACRDLPELRAGFEVGDIGADQMRLVARVYANRRVRDLMGACEDRFVADAAAGSFDDFKLRLQTWEQVADADGAAQANERIHERRDVFLVQDFDRSWHLSGGFAAFQGAEAAEILDYYIDAERLADWEKARAEHGDDATEAHLPRSEPQRRADAFVQLCHDAAGADGSAVPVGWHHNIVWDEATFLELAARLDPDYQPQRLDPDSSCCRTIDGVPLEPVEAFANATQAAIARVVVDAAGVVIDQGQARFFTGGARHAVKLSSTTCVWPGCQVPSSKCEADHLVEHANGGRTNPGNGAPMCGRHNRWKQKRFRVWRDPAGTWHTHRPDGTEID